MFGLKELDFRRLTDCFRALRIGSNAADLRSNKDKKVVIESGAVVAAAFLNSIHVSGTSPLIDQKQSLFERIGTNKSTGDAKVNCVRDFADAITQKRLTALEQDLETSAELKKINELIEKEPAGSDNRTMLIDIQRRTHEDIIRQRMGGLQSILTVSR